MSAQTTEASTLWCGKRHNNCRALVIENEDGLQDNLAFLQRGLLGPLRDTTPFDEVRLVSQEFNSCDFALVATSSLAKQLVLLEVDGRQHAGGGQYSPEAEHRKNTENFAAGQGHDKILMLRVSPSGRYHLPSGEEADIDKKARWLIVRDWIVTFLRAPYGTYTHGAKTLAYLFYNYDSPLIDRRAAEFDTVVAYQPPALPAPTLPDLADWACTLTPYGPTKGCQHSKAHLALSSRHPQPPRS